MKIIFISLLFIFLSCEKKNDLELEILTNKMNALKVSPDKYFDYVLYDNKIEKKSVTVLTYKLTNNSSKTYYFNLDNYNEVLENDYIKVDRVFLSISDSLNKKALINASEATAGPGVPIMFKQNEYLNYNPISRHNFRNFVIHSKETLYFEWFVVLPFGNNIEHLNYNVVLDTKKKYFANILMSSDSTDYKKTLSRTDLKTIQENNYEVYNGVVKSINKIPIKISEAER